MKSTFHIFLLFLVAHGAMGQELIDGKWVDNNLQFRIEKDLIKSKGELYFCIADQSRDACIENLSSGFELKIYDAQGRLLWEGIGSGRRRGLKLPQAFPGAAKLTMKAFKPYVINKRTGNRIYQDEAIILNYQIK